MHHSIPQGFMTAAMQVHARANRIAIDELKFQTLPTKMFGGDAAVAKPELGVHVHGLFLQGCGWDVEAGCLVESEKNVLFLEIPMLWLKPVFIKELNLILAAKELEDYKCLRRSEIGQILIGRTKFVGDFTGCQKYF